MPSQQSFPQTDQSRVRRVAARAQYDKDTVHAILDQAWLCHVGIVEAGHPVVIPMVHGRDGDRLLFHGSTKSRLMQHLSSGQEVSIVATLFDGLVLARSLFHHSMNYRSVVGFGTGTELASDEEKLDALRILSERLIPGRWQDARQPSAKELKATAVCAVTLHSASAKVRSGGPVDDAEDMDGPHWAGVIPFREVAAGLEPDAKLVPGIAIPPYVRALAESASAG